MSVKFKTHPFLRKLLNYQEVVEAEGNTIGECIDNLDSRFPGFKQQVVGKKDRFKDTLEVYLNNDPAYPEQLRKPVKDGDTVTIITYIAGG